MWKKSLILRSDSGVQSDNDNKVSVKNHNESHNFSATICSQNIGFTACVKDGNLVLDKRGSLVVSHQYFPLFCNSDLFPHDAIIQQTLGPGCAPVPDQVTPLDLSLLKVEMKEEAVIRDNTEHDSGYQTSPPLVDLTNTPDEDHTQEVRETDN